MVTEEFLFFVWKNAYFNTHGLKTTEGAPLQIQKLGYLNTNAGPDFLEGEILLNKTHWAGHIEIHTKTSDFYKHKHHQDSAYNNVVLHVVYQHDYEVNRADGTPIPTLELGPYILAETKAKYAKLMSNPSRIPCEQHLPNVPEITVKMMLHRALVDRMEQKTQRIIEILGNNLNDWQSAFYQIFVRSWGLKVNQEPFQALARAVPLNIVERHTHLPYQIEALYFGQAGFLSGNPTDQYPKRLKKEFQFLKKKYQLSPMEDHRWNFLRLRPPNFPTLRIAQLSSLVKHRALNFSKLIHLPTSEDAISALQIRTVDPYWESHFRFGKTAEGNVPGLGRNTVVSAVINTLIPLMFLYGKYRDDQDWCDKALKWLEELPAEENTITKQWKNRGFDLKSAYDTQAILQLNNEFCNLKRCLDCKIGNYILQ